MNDNKEVKNVLNDMITKIENDDKKDKEKELNDKAHKITSLMVKGTSKKILGNKKKENIDTSDEKTVVADTNPQTEAYKVNFNSFKKLMKIYEKLPDNATIDNLSPEDQIKLKGYMKAIGIPMQTKKLDKLRKKI